MPKKKQSKEKNEPESTEKPTRNPTGETLGHVSRRSAASPPPRWNSPTPRDDRLPAHDPGGRYETTHDAPSGYKRRHRSSPHRNARKHRHDRHGHDQKRTGWETTPPVHAPSTMTHPAHRGQAHPRHALPSTSDDHEPLDDGHNSGDEYVAPTLPENIDEVNQSCVKSCVTHCFTHFMHSQLDKLIYSELNCYSYFVVCCMLLGVCMV